MSVPSNWWENFFEGVAVDLWVQGLPPEYTEREAEVLVRTLAVPCGAEVLDVPCGAGRLSLALAQRGYRLTGIDWSAEFLTHARSRDPHQQVTWHQRDMRDLPWRARFDGAFCVGNSFGYLDDEANEVFLRAVAAALKPGARFVLETPMVLENLLGHLQDRAWWEVAGMHFLVENKYDPMRGRLDIEYTFVCNGRVEVRHGSHRAYSCRELVRLIEAAGFSVEIDQPWTRKSDTAWFVATRR